jgi:predicted Holliday junction resolvase-like endonuclease
MIKGEKVYLIFSVILFSLLLYFCIKYYLLNLKFDNKLATYKNTELNNAMQEYKTKCDKELEAFKQEMRGVCYQEAQTQLQQWKIDESKDIRQDAINKSQSVIMGKVVEHLVPYLPTFSYNPKDARFLGSPVDLIVFDGLSEGELKQIVFIEVKTGQSQLSQREKMIRDAINLGKVKWEEIRHAVENKTDATMKRLGLSFGK